MTARVFVVILAVALMGTAAQAQEFGTPERSGAPNAAIPCSSSDDCPVLTLDDVRRRVLATSPSARANRLEDDRAAARVLNARGGFEPALVSRYEYKTQDDADKLNVLRSGVSWPLNLPASPTLKFDYRRGLGSSIDPSVKTSRVGETRLGLSFAPLGGFRTDKSRAALDKARLAPRRADALQARKRNRLLLKASRAFWDWVKARQTLEVSRGLLRLAERRQALVTKKARAGQIPAVDSVDAARTTASRQATLEKARRTAREKRIKLATFLWEEDGSPATFRYAPPDLDMPAPVDTTRRADAVETALARRPMLRVMDLKRQKTEIEQRLAQEQLRPKVKLEAQAVSYTDSPLNISDVKVGFEVDQPFFSRSRRSEVEKTEIALRDLKLKQDIARRTVRADVKSALAALSQAHRRAQSAQRNERLAEQLRRLEQRRFEQGQGTLFVLNKREQSLAKARKQFIAAQISTLKAHATFQWATGTIADPYVDGGRRTGSDSPRE
ncbi:TolC family protein [Salinibacter ruber]|uniref:TolC family protein n=1 Tax=Salinibacter ruber TaxID=146919 RepID=UPI00216A941F|nr:TolC family protein [Salinibacter ruber]MCS3644146.1 outer membrane protein TolC [Salinibacter ruber]